MINGSLDNWLHPETITSIERSDIATRKLNLRERMDIAVDVAVALSYLHHECGTSIVHCDLNPENVLLDEKLVAHVSDFGLAKFLLQDVGNSHDSSSIGVRGTVGYAPPGINSHGLSAIIHERLSYIFVSFVLLYELQNTV